MKLVKLIYIFLTSSLCGQLYAQSVQICPNPCPDGEHFDIGGTIVNLEPEEESAYFTLINESDTTLNVHVERVVVEWVEGWVDGFSLGAAGMPGSLYLLDYLEPTDTFVSPNVISINSGIPGYFNSFVNNRSISGCGLFRYFFVNNDTDELLNWLDIRYCSTASIGENQWSDVNVFPNPTSGTFEVIGKNVNNATCDVCILDLTGKLVFKSQLFSNQLDIAHLEPGIYLMSLVDRDSGNVVYKTKINRE